MPIMSPAWTEIGVHQPSINHPVRQLGLICDAHALLPVEVGSLKSPCGDLWNGSSINAIVHSQCPTCDMAITGEIDVWEYPSSKTRQQIIIWQS